MMDEQGRQEKKNKRIGWLALFSVQLTLLPIFYFIIVWKEPVPTIFQYGIELAFITPTNTSTAVSSIQPVTEEVEGKEDDAEENVNETATGERESVALAEQPKTITQEVGDVPVIQKEETNREISEETIETKALMKHSSGHLKEKNENQSNKEEEIDRRSIYESQNASTKASENAILALAGWVWDFQPEPNDQSDQLGKIVYEIVVDQDGYLVKIKMITSTVSPVVERKYRQSIEKLTFSKTTDDTVAPSSTGTITFIIKPR